MAAGDLKYTSGASELGLIEASGLLGDRGSLTVENCEKYLRQQPLLTLSWQGLSRAHRAHSSGWGFSGTIVDHAPNGPELRFADPVRACAEFIVRHVADIVTFLDELPPSEAARLLRR